MTIIKDGDTQAIGLLQDNNLYRMLFQTIITNEANITTSSNLRLWHKRLGHVSLKTMREMAKQNALDIGQIPHDAQLFCESCQLGKQHRLPFQNHTPRDTLPGELIHTDVGGPMQTESIGGLRFYIIFKDDATCFTYIYFMRHKSDVYEKFKQFHAMIWNKFNRSIISLRLDNGREYINEQMKHYTISQGIQLETTAPYTPEQNGCSERHNRTLIEMARTMLQAKGLHTKLWAEAMNTAVYINNGMPTVRRDGKIPYEMWTNSKINLSHMRTFGCEAFVYVPKTQRRKWDTKSKK